LTTALIAGFNSLTLDRKTKCLLPGAKNSITPKERNAGMIMCDMNKVIGFKNSCLLRVQALENTFIQTKQNNNHETDPIRGDRLCDDNALLLSTTAHGNMSLLLLFSIRLKLKNCFMITKNTDGY
jgi:hypothetical protein